MIGAEHIKELTELAEGYGASVEAEQTVVAGLASYRKAFQEGDRQPHTTRMMRIQLDAEANVRRSTRSAAAIRAALAVLTSQEAI